MFRAVEKKKNFERYVELESKLQKLIVDKMQADDRCRFSGCSKLARKDAKSSKNYMYELKFHLTEHQIYIIVSHGAYDLLDNTRQGHILRFAIEAGKKCVECRSLRRRKLWANRLDNSTDLEQLAVQRFKNMLKKNQGIVKKLSILISHPAVPANPVDFEIQNLSNLEKLTVFEETDIRQFLSKTTKKLKCLAVYGKNNCEILQNCGKICHVQEYLHSPYTQLNNQQLLRLSSPYVIMHIGKLTEDDIFNFIALWRNGTKQVDCYQWNLTGSNFNVKKFFQLFRAEIKGAPTKILEIKHSKEAGSRAEILYSSFGKGQNDRSLTFRGYKKE